ncbi:MAG TPA: glutamate-5-semialdehyde dehydrogenase [Candidatus Angelobacter sp.]|jgi:glutamate-5-semialdehyde dehydrogenase|nr:glutamate-5-semialdehyde dehydrogenase [Candidatus Angelobacter sp.]
MSSAADYSQTDVAVQVLRARRAARELARLSAEQRNQILLAAADRLQAREAEILKANREDCESLEREIRAGTASAALLKRLKASSDGIGDMARRIRDVARLEDPLGRVLSATELDDGFMLQKVSCALGVVAVIFESRPDVVPQVGSLAIKTGNGLVLKGGAEAQHTNRVLVAVWHEALAGVSPSLRHAICSLVDRADVARILEMDRDIDLVVPRGSTEFVNYVFQHSRIPVLGHGSGICHIYVDSAADLGMAREVIIDAKTQYPAACNSVEKVLIHKDVAQEFVPELVSVLQSAGVEVRGCPQTAKLLPRSQIIPATEEDWHTEYGDLKITIKVVSDMAQAIEHINHYGSRHTESILTRDQRAAELFMDEVDAAGVFHNASTRFADGFRYGLGAELGISNSKLHARGPVGLEGLLTYKYKLHGSGQTVTDYAKGKRTFKHRRI